jgi:hypothetical protein
MRERNQFESKMPKKGVIARKGREKKSVAICADGYRLVIVADKDQQ